MSDILHVTVDQLKFELTSRGVVQLGGLTKPDLQSELCKLLSMDVTQSKLQWLVTLAILDKTSPTHSNHSSKVNSPVHSKTETKLSSDRLFELKKMRMKMQERKNEL